MTSPEVYGAATTNMRIITTVPRMIAIIAISGTIIVFLFSPFALNSMKLYMAGYDLILIGIANIATRVSAKHMSLK
ncbi:hypothetical protein [Burkholderia sp. Bp9012]|uniref:hypothetical protein n=1 Tax=Burkholderia sp. Bp9012 TaxID=2184562 RepID=UPI000F5A3A0D|nr:hypothetical protein [Burkholderia sp. Bp9012]